MKSKIELKEVGIKNCVCYYFDGIINGTKTDLSNISLDKNLYENISFTINSNRSKTIADWIQ